MKNVRNVSDLLRDIEQEPETKEKIDFYRPLSRLVLEAEETRSEKGVTQAALAKMLKTRQGAISRFENMKHLPNYSFLVRLAQALGGQLSLTIDGDFVYSIPKKYRLLLKKMAEKEKTTVQDIVEKLFNRSLNNLFDNDERNTFKPSQCDRVGRHNHKKPRLPIDQRSGREQYTNRNKQ